MAKKCVVQIRFFGDSNTYLNQSAASTVATLDKNEPVGLTAHNLFTGEIFQHYKPILQLGIQALPGTRFTLNDNIEPLIIGASGMYELDLTNSQTATIYHLAFDMTSLEAINNNPDGYLIVDIIYDAEG